MPWQVAYVHVALEYRTDPQPGENLYYYDDCNYTTMRQVGKTIIAFVDMCRVAIHFEATNTGWTGESGKDAAEKWVEELYPQIEKNPIRQFINPGNKGLASGNGNEKIRWRNGSASMLLRGGHGRTLVRGYDDEIWADQDSWRDQAVGPGMSTAVSQFGHRQRWRFSTAGDETSERLAATVAAGYRAVEEDRGYGVCFADWGCPDGMDPADLKSHWLYNPALGITQDMATLESYFRDYESRGELDEFARAHCNIRRGTSAADIITEEQWQAVQARKAIEPDPKKIRLALSIGRRWSAIAASDGNVVVLNDCREGDHWIAEKWDYLTGKYGPGYVASKSRAAAVPNLERVQQVPVGDVCVAAESFVQSVRNGLVTVRPSPVFDDAIEGAKKRTSGDLWRFSHDRSTNCVAALEAASLALAGEPQAEPKTSRYETGDLLVF